MKLIKLVYITCREAPQRRKLKQFLCQDFRAGHGKCKAMALSPQCQYSLVQHHQDSLLPQLRLHQLPFNPTGRTILSTISAFLYPPHPIPTLLTTSLIGDRSWKICLYAFRRRVGLQDNFTIYSNLYSVYHIIWIMKHLLLWWSILFILLPSSVNKQLPDFGFLDSVCEELFKWQNIYCKPAFISWRIMYDWSTKLVLQSCLLIQYIKPFLVITS